MSHLIICSYRCTYAVRDPQNPSFAQLETPSGADRVSGACLETCPARCLEAPGVYVRRSWRVDPQPPPEVAKDEAMLPPRHRSVSRTSWMSTVLHTKSSRISRTVLPASRLDMDGARVWHSKRRNVEEMNIFRKR